MPLEKPLCRLLCYITASFAGTRGGEQEARGRLVPSVFVCLCAAAAEGVFEWAWWKMRDKWRDGRLGWGGVGWHNEWHIVKSLPTKQSLLPCKWDSLDKDLFDGTHAEYEAVNSLISIPQSWLAKTRESQPESISAKPNIDLFNGVRESKIANLLSIVYEAV